MSSRILHTPSAADGTVRRRRLRNLLVAILVPVLLAAAYLAGMSGADARDSSLPALIVNEDEMYETTTETGETTTVIAGRLLVTALTDPENAYGFSWGLANAATAEAALAAGDAYVVVTIPSDFSESVASLGTNQPKPAQIQVTTDQSHDYLGGQAAGALTNALTSAFGTEITKMIAVGLAQGFSETGSALQEAADGARQLAGGADQLGTGFDEYTAGQAQITDGLSQSATGASQLSDGVAQYTDGASQLATGVTSYTSGVQTYVDGVSAYSTGVDEFAGGVAQAGQAVGQISQEDLDAISQSGPALLEAADAFDAASATYAESIRPVLENADAAKAELVEACGLQPDPADQQTCIESAEALAGGAGGAMTVLDGIFAQDVGGQLRQLAPMVAQLPAMVGGVQQLVSAAGQIQAAGVQIRDGGGQLTAGGGELATGASALSTGGDALATGASDLASGLALLSDGQAQLTAGNPQLRDGMTQLSGGATSLADGLQDGATQARDALGDPDTYGDALANPVEATLVAQHSPGFGGMLLAIVLPIVVWLAALVTSLARRIVTREALASTGSNARLLVRALARVVLPVAAVAVVVAIVGHVWAGVPFWSILGTIGIGLLAALAIGALHVLFSALWGRRFGAIASVAFLALQLLAVRGFLPMEFRAPWLEALSTISPLAHATAGLQLIYAGGGVGGVVQAILSIALIGLLAVGAAGLVIGRKRSTSLGRVVDLRAFGERPAAAG